jgi:proline iminopeptidase
MVRHNQSRKNVSKCGGKTRALAAVIGLVVGAMGAYFLAIRQRMLCWGATEEEAQGPYPGADLVPGGSRSATMAVTIDAPPSSIWPWLVQMGYGRAGWYSWDHLDNLGQPSAPHLHPEWQNIHIGDFLAPATGPAARSWEVAALEPERFLGLRASYDLRRMRWFDPNGPRPLFSTLSLWGFQLRDLPGGRTRLIVSGYWSLLPRWLQPLMSVLMLEPSHWIMQTRQFANLKRRVEGSVLVSVGGTSAVAAARDSRQGIAGSRMR